MRLRFASGLREVLRGVELNNVKCVIFAPDIEPISAPGGLDTVTQEIMNLCKEKQIPIIYAMSRRYLGRSLHIKRGVSAVAVFHVDGVYESFKKVKQLAQDAREAWQVWKARTAATEKAAGAKSSTVVTIRQNNTAKMDQSQPKPNIVSAESLLSESSASLSAQ
jgi:ribosomal protein L7Ae-like RNA K-turn-binding protein